MKKFYTPQINDERLKYAKEFLEKNGYYAVSTFEKADFVLMGINPKEFHKYNTKPVFAGNVSACNVFDYTKKELFALENAFLTAEGAVSKAISSSVISLINSNILIIGYGRISKALGKYLSAFSPNITVCARNDEQKLNAKLCGFDIISFDELKTKNNFDFVFNTVPHPVLNEKELSSFKKNTLVMDLASFPGGVDKLFSKAYELNYIEARGVPAEYSPKSSGEILAKTIISMIEKGEVSL